MQSTGQTSTHELSFVPMQGSAMTYAMKRSFLFKRLGGTGVALYEAPARPATRRSLPGWVCALGGLTLLAAFVRFAGLGHQSFWYDEAWTDYLVRLRPGELLTLVPRTESTPPLYYMVAWAWVRVFGRDEAGLRSLSALAGTLTVPVAYATGTTLATRRVGLVVAALAATSPLLVWYSQEARSYMLLVLLAALSLLCFAHARQRPSRVWLVGWAGASVAALATHYFAVFVVAPEAVLLLAARPVACGPERRRALAAVGIAALAGAGLLVLAIGQRNHGNAGWIRDIPLGHRLGELPRELLAGFPPAVPWVPVVGGALILAAIALLLSRGEARERRAALLAGGIGAAALLAPLALAAGGLDYLLTRNVLVAWLPFALVVAAGLGARRAARLGALLTAGLCAVSLVAVDAVAHDADVQRPPWRTLSATLGAPRSGRAIVLVHAGFGLPLAVYRPGTWLMERLAAPLREIDVVTGDEPNTRFVWWGAVGGIARARLPLRPPAAGFASAGRVRAGDLTVTRFVAARRITVRWQTLRRGRGTVVLLDRERSPVPP
jgi:mannosyltransferase